MAKTRRVAQQQQQAMFQGLPTDVNSGPYIQSNPVLGRLQKDSEPSVKNFVTLENSFKEIDDNITLKVRSSPKSFYHFSRWFLLKEQLLEILYIQNLCSVITADSVLFVTFAKVSLIKSTISKTLMFCWRAQVLALLWNFKQSRQFSSGFKFKVCKLLILKSQTHLKL